MNIKQINLKQVAGIIILGFTVGACNMGSSSDKIADTASTAAYSTPDSMTATGPTASTESAATTPSGTADTSATASSTKTNGSSTTTTAKKKGKIRIEMGPEVKNPKVSMDKSGIYTYAEVSPAFPGGQNGIDNYVNNNIDYPQTALDNSQEGRIGVSFVVDENGKVTDVHSVGTKLGSGLDEEAVRVVSNMPKWTPGMVKGKAVKTRMTLPIVFQIEG